MAQPNDNEKSHSHQPTAEERERFVAQMMESVNENEESLRSTPLSADEKEKFREFLRNMSVQAELAERVEGSLDLGEVIRKSFRIYSHGGSIDVDAIPEPAATFQPQLGRGWVPVSQSLPIPHLSGMGFPYGQKGAVGKGKKHKPQGLRIKAYDKNKIGSGSTPGKGRGSNDDSDMLFGENGKIYNIQGEPLKIKYKVLDKNGHPVAANVDATNFDFAPDGSIYDKNGQLQDFKWQIESESGQPVRPEDLDEIVPLRNGVPFSQAVSKPNLESGPRFGEDGKIYNAEGELVVGAKWNVVDRNGQSVADVSLDDYIFNPDGSVYDKQGKLQDFQWQLESESGRPISAEERSAIFREPGGSGRSSPLGKLPAPHFEANGKVYNANGEPVVGAKWNVVDRNGQSVADVSLDDYIFNPDGSVSDKHGKVQDFKWQLESESGRPISAEERTAIFGEPGASGRSSPLGKLHGASGRSSPLGKLPAPHFEANGKVYNANGEPVEGTKWNVVDKNGKPVVGVNPDDYVFNPDGSVSDKQGKVQDFKWQLESESGRPISAEERSAIFHEPASGRASPLGKSPAPHFETNGKVYNANGEPVEGTKWSVVDKNGKPVVGVNPDDFVFNPDGSVSDKNGKPQNFKWQLESESGRPISAEEVKAIFGEPGADGRSSPQGKMPAPHFETNGKVYNANGEPVVGAKWNVVDKNGQPVVGVNPEDYVFNPDGSVTDEYGKIQDFKWQLESESGKPISAEDRKAIFGVPSKDRGGMSGVPSKLHHISPSKKFYSSHFGKHGIVYDANGEPTKAKWKAVDKNGQRLDGLNPHDYVFNPDGSVYDKYGKLQDFKWQIESESGEPISAKERNAIFGAPDTNRSGSPMGKFHSSSHFGKNGKVYNKKGESATAKWKILDQNGQPVEGLNPDDFVFNPDGSIYDKHGNRQDLNWQLESESGEPVSANDRKAILGEPEDEYQGYPAFDPVRTGKHGVKYMHRGADSKTFDGEQGSRRGSGTSKDGLEGDGWIEKDDVQSYPRPIRLIKGTRKLKKNQDEKSDRDSIDSAEADFSFAEDGKVYNINGEAVTLTWKIVDKTGTELQLDPTEYVFDHDGNVYDLRGNRQDFTWQLLNEEGEQVELPATIGDPDVPVADRTGVRFAQGFVLAGPDGNLIKPITSGLHIVHSRGAFHLDTYHSDPSGEVLSTPVKTGAEVIGPSGLPLMRVTESGRIVGPKGTPLNAGTKILDPRGNPVESKGLVKGPGGLPIFLIQTGHQKGSEFLDDKGERIIQNETGTMVLDKNGNILMMFDVGGEVTNSKSHFTQAGRIGTNNEMEVYDYYVMDIGGNEMIDNKIQRRVQKMINKYIAPPGSPVMALDPDDPFKHLSTQRAKKSKKNTPGLYDFPKCLQGTEWKEFLAKNPVHVPETVGVGKQPAKGHALKTKAKTEGEDIFSILSDEEVEPENDNNQDESWEKLKQSGFMDRVDLNDPILIAKKKAINSLNKFKLAPITKQHWDLKKALDGTRPITRQEVAFHCENGDILLIRYNKVINAMPIVMTHVNEHQGKILPIINSKGGDISHWFNPITGEPRTEIDLRTGKKILSMSNGVYYGLAPFRQKLIDEEGASRISSAKSEDETLIKIEAEMDKDYNSFKTGNFSENDVSGFPMHPRMSFMGDQEYEGEGDDGLYVDNQMFPDPSFHRMYEMMGEYDEEVDGEGAEKVEMEIMENGEFTVIKPNKNRDSLKSPESNSSFIMESTGFRSPDKPKSNSSGSLPGIAPSVMINSLAQKSPIKSPLKSIEETSKVDTKFSNESIDKDLSQSQTEINKETEEQPEKRVSDENIGQKEQRLSPIDEKTEEEKSHSSAAESGSSSTGPLFNKSGLHVILEEEEGEVEDGVRVYFGEELGEYEHDPRYTFHGTMSMLPGEFSKSSIGDISERGVAFSTVPLMGSAHSFISEVPSGFSKSTPDTTAATSTVYKKPDRPDEKKWSGAEIHYEEPWWVEPKYVCGYVPQRNLRIKIINSISYDEKLLVISKEYTINDVMRYYLPFNHNAMAYRWEDIYGNVLHPDKTVVENGLVDLAFADDNGFNSYPVIILVFIDGFENHPIVSLNPRALASQMTVPAIPRNY